MCDNVIVPLRTEQVYDAARSSYRGGMCQVFSWKKYQSRLFYVDVNSLYPFIMHSKKDFAYDIAPELIRYPVPRLFQQGNSFNICPQNLYCLQEFHLAPSMNLGWFPVMITNSVNDRNPSEILYPSNFRAAQDNLEPMWVWGESIVELLKLDKLSFVIVKAYFSCAKKGPLFTQIGVVY